MSDESVILAGAEVRSIVPINGSAAAIQNAQSRAPALRGLQYPSRKLTQLDVWHDPDMSAIWCITRADASAHYSFAMLDEIVHVMSEAKGYIDSLADPDLAPQFWIMASDLPGVFRLGGDLEIFLDCIARNDRAALRDYAIACIQAIHISIVNCNAPLVSIAVVEGDALGGGFEAALTFDFIVAEKRARFGFPEVLFNSFPGMGAYSLLSRKLGGQKAKDIIRSGQIFTAEQMKDLGIVHRLTENGEARKVAVDLVREFKSKHASLVGQNRVERAVSPITFKELEDVVDIWVDTMMEAQRKDRRKMELLLSAQKRLKSK